MTKGHQAGGIAVPEQLGPAQVLCTDRAGGVSDGSYASNNLGLHVADNPDAVRRNRDALLQHSGLRAVQWLNQVHGTAVHTASAATVHRVPDADAVWTREPGIGLAILTADCLPVVLADRNGELVAAAHAGWRGLVAGVLRELVAALPVAPAQLTALIGPAIGVSHFEVGAEVVAEFEAAGLGGKTVTLVEQAGEPSRFKLDLAQACRLELERLGVTECAGGHWCTYAQEQFYSWRRETHRAARFGETPVTGRQATLIWLAE